MLCTLLTVVRALCGLQVDFYGNDYIAFRMTSSGRGDRPPSWLK